MDRQRLEGQDTDGLFYVWVIFSLMPPYCMYDCHRTSETAQTELVYLIKGIWILPIILDDVDVVRGGQEAGKCGGTGIPERGRYNA